MRHCDNFGVVHAWIILGSTDKGVLEIERQIAKVTAENNFIICIKHIASITIETADALPGFRWCVSGISPRMPNAHWT